MRYLVRGYPVGKIAAHLGITRHTITRWKHDPHFVAAMEALRREMTAAIVSPAARAAPPPRPMDPLAAHRHQPSRVQSRGGKANGQDDFDDIDDIDDDEIDDDNDPEMSDEEAAETEAWIEQILAAKLAGTKLPPARGKG